MDIRILRYGMNSANLGFARSMFSWHCMLQMLRGCYLWLIVAVGSLQLHCLVYVPMLPGPRLQQTITLVTIPNYRSINSNWIVQFVTEGIFRLGFKSFLAQPPLLPIPTPHYVAYAQTPGLKWSFWSFCLCLSSNWDHRHMPLSLVDHTVFISISHE